VASADEVWEGEMLGVEADGVPVLLVNVDGHVFAYEDRCPHAASLLSGGRLEANVLTCAAHEWVFDCRVGEGINPQATRLRAIAVRVEEDAISVDPGADR
jgi:toluene monooxygenase system ferredoxin subunit